MTTFVLGQGPSDLVGQVSRRLAEGRIAHAVTGACAALLVAPHVTDVRTCEVWVDPAISESLITGALGTTPVERGGNVVVLLSKTDAPLFAASEVEGAVVAVLDEGPEPYETLVPTCARPASTCMRTKPAGSR